MTAPHDFGRYGIHPAAALFPIMPDDELDKLAADIKENGLQNPIVVLGDQILDGRNRYLACRRVGAFCLAVEYRGKESPTAWVMSQNIRRRHLSESQRAMLAMDLMPLFEAEAKERQRQGGREKVPAKLPGAGEARAFAAAAANVSPRTVQDTLTVQREGMPETIAAVTSGKLAVSAAAKKIRAARKSPSASVPLARKRACAIRSWKVPWGIAALAAKLRSRRSREDIEQLVRLLTENCDAR